MNTPCKCRCCKNWKEAIVEIAPDVDQLRTELAATREKLARAESSEGWLKKENEQLREKLKRAENVVEAATVFTNRLDYRFGSAQVPDADLDEAIKDYRGGGGVMETCVHCGRTSGFVEIEEVLSGEQRLRTQLQAAEERVKELDRALNHLINKSNVVTAAERHGIHVSVEKIRQLYEAQLKAEMVNRGDR